MEEEKENQKEAGEEAAESAMMGGAETEIEGEDATAEKQAAALNSAKGLKGNVAINFEVPKPRCGSLFKIFLGWLQMFSSLSVTFDVPWPPAFKGIQMFFFPLVNIDFMAAFTGFKCQVDASFLPGFRLHMFVPIILAAVVFACYVAARIYKIIMCCNDYTRAAFPNKFKVFVSICMPFIN